MYRHIPPSTQLNNMTHGQDQYYSWLGECLVVNMAHDQGRPIEPILCMAPPSTLSSSTNMTHGWDHHSPLRSQYDAWQGEWPMMLPQTSTLPLSEGRILCHAKLVPEVYELCPGQRLGQDIYYLLIYRNVPKSYNSSVDISLMKWYLISMCFHRSWNTGSLKASHSLDYHCRSQSSQAPNQTNQQVVSKATQLLYLHH